MPTIRLLILAALVTSISIVIPRQGFVSAQRNATDTYAITNARIFTVSGPVIERGSVVIRGGLIAAVGANVTPPADARIIDGTGLNVYPGLIDSSTSLGIPQPSPTPTPSPGSAGAGLGQFRTQTTNISAPNSAQLPACSQKSCGTSFGPARFKLKQHATLYPTA